MPTIQVIVDKELLRLADKEAHRSKMNRSALIRVALRDYLRRLHNREKERRDRKGTSDSLRIVTTQRYGSK